MAKLFVTDVSRSEEKKCGGCNWGTQTFYGIGVNKASARSDFKGINPKNYGLGLCANCVTEMIVENKYEIA